MSPITVGRLGVAALSLSFLLAGCSGAEPGPEAQKPEVATLRSEGPKPSRPADVNDLRPLVRLDASDEDVERLYQAWAACHVKEGGPEYEDPRTAYRKSRFDKDPEATAILKACAAKEPERYEERQQRLDITAFVDNQRQWYQCAKKEGYKLTAPQEDYQFGITEVGPNGDFQSPKMEACRIAAFKD